MITLGVTDLDDILARLATHESATNRVDTYSNGVRHVVLHPDGNSPSRAEAPSQFATGRGVRSGVQAAMVLPRTALASAMAAARVARKRSTTSLARRDGASFH